MKKCDFCNIEIKLSGVFTRPRDNFFICKICFEKIIGFSFIENYEKDDSLCQYCKNLVFSNPCDPNYYLFIFYMHIKSFFIHGDCFEEIFCNCNTVQ